MSLDPVSQSPRRKRRHGAKNKPPVTRHHPRHQTAAPPANPGSLLPESMREIVTDAGTFVFDDTLSPSISYFLFRSDHQEVSETFEHCMLAGEPLEQETLDALHYIAELRLSDGWQTLMADLFIDRDLVEDEEVQDIVESTLVLLDDIEPGPEGTALTVYWVQEIGVYTPDEDAYNPPVAELMDKGEPAPGEWEDYLVMGFTADHITELIRMAVDQRLYFSEDVQENYAPIHACRVLGQLQATEAIFPLLTVVDLDDELDDEQFGDDLHKVFAMIGGATVHPLVDYIRDKDQLHSWTGRIWAVVALLRVAQHTADLRPEVIKHLRSLLEEQLILARMRRPDVDDKLVNGFMVGALSELGAVELMPVIRQVFEADILEVYPCGELPDVEQLIKNGRF